MNKKYTAAQLAFVSRRRRMTRQALLAALARKFRRLKVTLLQLQDLCNRKGWGVGERKGRQKGYSRRYSKIELVFVRRRRKVPRLELHAAFVRRFRRRDVTPYNIKQLCARRGWLVGSRKGRFKGRSLRYSKAEIAFINRRKKMPRRTLHAAFIAKFDHHDVSLDNFKALCDRRGLRTGRSGQFEKGLVPANKGKKMPYNAGSARTQFKKGHRQGRSRENYKPIGSTRFSKEGYLERKIHDGMPLQSRWRGVHLINWEILNGAVPARHVLKCLDGDKRNTDPGNWKLIPRATLARLNKRWRGEFETAPADLKQVMLAMAKLEHQIGEKKRGQGRSHDG